MYNLFLIFSTFALLKKDSNKLMNVKLDEYMQKGNTGESNFSACDKCVVVYSAKTKDLEKGKRVCKKCG